ncbi:unnamed protein product [Soboliphyme baturini]|uniref:Peptidase_M14 domain-containing protein n=1 Tax=Soboliphyme baturini TaxID=241478 RepID=A0A183IF31_9BILA|nr:unnamed protein product [Soboliphyme baturini]
MHNVAAYYPNIARVHKLGYSHENRPIEMLQIGYPIDKTDKKAVFIDAGMHAREWASHSTAVYFIYKLVSSLDTRPELRKYINNLTWYIVPAVNPDGYEYTRNSTRPEVDLNRNFNFFWGEYGSSKFPCHETYAGRSQFSEPETKAISKFLYEHRHNIKAYITMHTYSQLWIHSYSHMVRTYPPDLKELVSKYHE